MIKRIQALLITLTAFAVTLCANAQGYLVDQRNDPAPPSIGFRYWSLPYFGEGPIGQEFTPSLSSLDFIELMTCGVEGATTATLQTRVHAGDIAAPALATSNPTTRTDAAAGVTHFDFPSAVQLVPGQIYVIELLQTSGDVWGVGDPGGGYSDGRMIWRGQPLSDGTDLWFREGATFVPEPSVAALWVTVAILCLLRRITLKTAVTLPSGEFPHP